MGFLFSSDLSRWLLSIYNNYNDIDKRDIQLKILLPLTPLSSSSDTYISSSMLRNYQTLQITSSRMIFYSLMPSLNSFCKDDLCTQLRQIQFPHAYALFLKDLSRLIKPTTTPNLSIELIWELMPDSDEYQRLSNEVVKYSLPQQQYVKVINNLIPDIWAEIGKKDFLSNSSRASFLGKQELFYSVTDGWGYVAIEDMIINNVESGPIQEVLTFVFSEANAPIVILPSHVINGLCKYSNKHYLQVMTPFHASELLAKNSSILSRLTYEQKLSLLKYIICNDPDPGLVLELQLLPLANREFVTFQNKQASTVYIIDQTPDILKLFSDRQYDKLLNPNIEQKLFEILSSEKFQGKFSYSYFLSVYPISARQGAKKTRAREKRTPFPLLPVFFSSGRLIAGNFVFKQRVYIHTYRNRKREKKVAENVVAWRRKKEKCLTGTNRMRRTTATGTITVDNYIRGRCFFPLTFYF